MIKPSASWILKVSPGGRMPAGILSQFAMARASPSSLAIAGDSHLGELVMDGGADHPREGIVMLEGVKLEPSLLVSRELDGDLLEQSRAFGQQGGRGLGGRGHGCTKHFHDTRGKEKVAVVEKTFFDTLRPSLFASLRKVTQKDEPPRRRTRGLGGRTNASCTPSRGFYATAFAGEFGRRESFRHFWRTLTSASAFGGIEKSSVFT